MLTVNIQIGASSYSIEMDEVSRDAIIKGPTGIPLVVLHVADVVNNSFMEIMEGVRDELNNAKNQEECVSHETVCDIIQLADEAKDELDNFDTEPDRDSVSELQSYAEDCPCAVETARDKIEEALEKLAIVKNALED